MESHMHRFHGTAARQLILVGVQESRGPGVLGPGSRVQGNPRIRLMQKDMYAELARRRRQAQMAARRWVDGT
jgi:hypothetical protein